MRFTFQNSLLALSLTANLLVTAYWLLEEPEGQSTKTPEGSQSSVTSSLKAPDALPAQAPTLTGKAAQALPAQDISLSADPQEQALDSQQEDALSDEPDLWELAKKNPVAVQSIKNSIYLRAEIDYQAFLKRYSDNPELQEAILEALVLRDSMLGSPEESEADAKEGRRQLRTLLGAEDYQSLQVYEDTRRSAWTLHDMRTILAANDLQLPLEKERALKAILSQVQKKAETSYPDNPTEQAKALYSEAVSASSHLLDDSELDALEQALEYEAQQIEALEIMNQLMRPKSNEGHFSDQALSDAS